MQIHPTLDTFYQSILAYAGMRYDEGVIKSNNDKINDIQIDDKPLTLPYFDNLKNPDGRHIFHPLNESYNSPETVFLAAYKKRLTLDINFRLFAMIDALLRVGIDVSLQKKVKSPKLLDMVSRIGEVDTTLRENFIAIVRYSQKKNEEAFLVDFHVKKNGQLKETPYAAIGKVNFILFNELTRALEDNTDGYKVFGARVRKKDILSLIAIFQIVFEDLEDTDVYTATTDMKVFRFFNALLLATYFVTAQVNKVANLLKDLKEPDLATEEMFSDLGWTNSIEEVYTLQNEIRSIPNQSNAKAEGHGLKVKEPATNTVHPQATHIHHPAPTNNQATHIQTLIPPSFDPNNVQRSQPAPSVQNAQVEPTQQAPSAPSVEDIIRGSVQQQQMYANQGYPMQGYPQQPMYAPPGYNQQPYPPQMQQPMQQPYPPQMQQPYPPQMQQPYPPQGYNQQPMYPQQPMQHMQRGMTPEQALQNMGGPTGGIPINPQLMQQPMQQPYYR